MKKSIAICLFWPCWLWGQESQSNIGDIPWQMLGYRNDTVQGLGSGVRSSGLPALNQRNFAITAASRYNIPGAGMIGIVMASGNGLSGKKIMLGAEVSPVHISVKGEIGYGLMLSKSLSIGISVGAKGTIIIDNRIRWWPYTELGFVNQMNKKVSWGAHFRQYKQQKTITTGFAYQLSDQMQLVAEIEKGSYKWFGFTLMLNAMLNNRWQAISGYKGHSGLTYCYMGYLHKKQILGAGLSFHPQLGSSIQFSFSKSFY